MKYDKNELNSLVDMVLTHHIDHVSVNNTVILSREHTVDLILSNNLSQSKLRAIGLDISGNLSDQHIVDVLLSRNNLNEDKLRAICEKINGTFGNAVHAKLPSEYQPSLRKYFQKAANGKTLLYPEAITSKNPSILISDDVVKVAEIISMLGINKDIQILSARDVLHNNNPSNQHSERYELHL